MGILDILLKVIDTASELTSNYVERHSNEYYSGYEKGSETASSMSDSELRSELKKIKENGNGADMRNAGKTRAMIDEYQNRNK